MPFNPFNGSDGPSFESPDGLAQKVQQTTKNLSAAAQQQAQATKKSFVDQLYGNTSSTEEDPTAPESGGQQTDQLQKIQQQMGTNAPSGDISTTSKTPEEQAQIEMLRKKLHKENYFDYEQKTVSEEAVLKVSHEKEQEWEQKQQEEAEEAQRKEEEKAQREESMDALEPAGKGAKGKGNGRSRMSRPIALDRAKTRTEINRGTTG